MATYLASHLTPTPTHSPTPTKALTMAILAADAAGWVVQTDLARDASARRLLRWVEADTVAEAQVRGQLAWLHARILGELLEPDDPGLDASLELFELGLELRGSASGAWILVITALLQDPAVMFW